jgi:hypothetical protein
LIQDIRPGAIVHTYIATIPTPKNKFGLISHIDRDSVVLFLVHSELPKFIQDSPALMTGVAKIHVADHPSFLNKDSWIRFGDPHAVRFTELARQIHAGERCLCGYGSERLITRLVRDVPGSKELAPIWQKRFCNDLQQYLDSLANEQEKPAS